MIDPKRELGVALKNVDYDLVKSNLSFYSTEWKFNPLSSLWMGRAWESILKQVNRPLKSGSNYQVFTEEELSTTLLEIESRLN